MSKKLFVVSDVHGHYAELMKALDGVGFDANNENHIFVGGHVMVWNRTRVTPFTEIHSYSEQCSTIYVKSRTHTSLGI